MNDPTLDKIVSVIVRAVHPNKIILFGSRARGDARPDSDYDFVVIKEGEMDEHATSVSVYVNLAQERDIIASVDKIPVSAAAHEGITAYAG